MHLGEAVETPRPEIAAVSMQQEVAPGVGGMRRLGAGTGGEGGQDGSSGPHLRHLLPAVLQPPHQGGALQPRPLLLPPHERVIPLHTMPTLAWSGASRPVTWRCCCAQPSLLLPLLLPLIMACALCGLHVQSRQEAGPTKAGIHAPWHLTWSGRVAM
jgi:hypothetical protein